MNEREALERIAKYPMCRSEEMSIETAREIARAALAAQAQQPTSEQVEQAVSLLKSLRGLCDVEDYPTIDGIISTLAAQAQHESKAIGYVVWGISNGKHYKHAIKLPEDAPVDGWQSDNCNLGEFWAGNDLVYLSQAPEVCSDGVKCGAGGYCITCPNMPAPEGGE